MHEGYQPVVFLLFVLFKSGLVHKISSAPIQFPERHYIKLVLIL